MFKKALYLLALQKLHTVDEHHRLQPSIVRASNHFAYHLGVPASKSPGPHGCAALHGWCEQTTANDWAAAAVEEMARTAASAKATTQAERRRGSDTGEEQNARGSFLRRFPPSRLKFSLYYDVKHPTAGYDQREAQSRAMHFSAPHLVSPWLRKKHNPPTETKGGPAPAAVRELRMCGGCWKLEKMAPCLVYGAENASRRVR
jgi:hypothetical protein